MGLRDDVTAITLVTFGTSLIDVFATRIASVNDSTADNSIGNVVAANAISVFLFLVSFIICNFNFSRFF